MIQNNHVTYRDSDHSYEVNGKPAISVTQFLKAIGIVEGFDDKPEIVKIRAKEAGKKGNFYDKLATEAMEEMKYEEEDWDLNEWQMNFIRKIQKIGAYMPNSQLLLGIDSPIVIAGRPDIMEEIEITHEDKKYIGYCGDLKTTYDIKIKDVTWQTNVYTYLRDPENHEKYFHFVIHWDEKAERFTVIALKTIPNKKIEAAFTAYQLDEKYIEQFDQLVDPKAFDNLLKVYEKKQEEVKEIEKKLNEFKEQLIKAMEDNFIEDGETENYKIHLTKGYERRTIAWSKILNERFKKRIEAANEILKELGKPEIIIETEEEVKKNATDAEKESNTSIAKVKSSVSIKKKEEK